MNHSAWIDPRIKLLTVAQVTAYLERHGWKRQPHPRAQMLVYGGKVDDDGLEIIHVFPSSEGASDYQMRLEELLGALGVIENRYAVAILEGMLGPGEKNGATHAVADSGVRQP